MREKYGKFYADWRDETGTRHMRAFASRNEAQRFQNDRRAETRLRKKAQASAMLLNTLKRGRRVGAAMLTSSSRRNSQKLRGLSRSTN